MTDSTGENTLKNAEMMETRYQRAQVLMQGIWTNKLTLNTTVFPIWIDDSDCFWYERQLKNGKQYRLVNSQTATNDIAFDHALLATTLAESVKQKIDADNLPIDQVDMLLSTCKGQVEKVRFNAFDKRWAFDAEGNTCKEIELTIPVTEVISPDGRYIVFLKDYNLWLRDLQSGRQKSLTQDGEENYVYAVGGSAWGSGSPVDPSLQVHWSLDSKQLITVQKDKRKIKTLPTVHHVPKDGSLRPTVEQAKVSYPGDDQIETLRLLAININNLRQDWDNPVRIQSANYRQIPIGRNNFGLFTAKLCWWAADNLVAYFVDMERDHKTVRLVEFDTQTGVTRMLFEEASDTPINLMLNADETPSLLPLPESGELIWFSERSGWAHLYLYDLATGQLKHKITSGDWLVQQTGHYDAERRELFIRTAGRGKLTGEERDPYYCDLARVNIDTGEIVTLAAGNHHYYAVMTPFDLNVITASGINPDVTASNSISPTGNFAVATRSRADETPVSLLVDRDGRVVSEVEVADLSAIYANVSSNWHWPEPVKLMAADSQTDIYGLVFRPSDFSTQESYPVVSHVVNIPEITWVSKGAFTNGAVLGMAYLCAAALAELGFIVVQIDGRGTPFRNKAFFDESYGWAESASNLADHVAGIKQLAARYPYMDLNRVGITTHPVGGAGSVQGLLSYPEFYKVGVAISLPDSRLIGASMWADKFEHVPHITEGHLYPEQLVENLEGKLLLMHGMLDWMIPPATVFRLVEALQKANKDFDMILLPNLGREWSSYLTRRAWDYLVKYLHGCEAPKEFKLRTIFEEL